LFRGPGEEIDTRLRSEHKPDAASIACDVHLIEVLEQRDGMFAG
jgi:hypothetical protein